MASSILFYHLSFAFLKSRLVVLIPHAVVLTSALAPSAGFMGDDVAFAVVDYSHTFVTLEAKNT